jgi:hypothetical protein
MVEEKPALMEREAVEPVRDIVDEAYEWPRVCAFVVFVGCRSADPDRLVSVGLGALGRVAVITN